MELQIGLSAVRDACKLVMRAREGIKSVSKADRSPVTAADIASQILIVEQLTQHFPTDGIIAEEDSDSLKDERTKQAVSELLGYKIDGMDLLRRKPVDESCSRFWTIDPIDGTKGFLKKNGQYCVCLALLEKEDAVWDVKLGILGCPELDSGGVLMYAIKDKGAFQVKDCFIGSTL